MNFTKRTYRKARDIYLDEALWYASQGDVEMVEYHKNLLKKVIARGKRERGIWK